MKPITTATASSRSDRLRSTDPPAASASTTKATSESSAAREYVVARPTLQSAAPASQGARWRGNADAKHRGADRDEEEEREVVRVVEPAVARRRGPEGVEEAAVLEGADPQRAAVHRLRDVEDRLDGADDHDRGEDSLPGRAAESHERVDHRESRNHPEREVDATRRRVDERERR